MSDPSRREALIAKLQLAKASWSREALVRIRADVIDEAIAVLTLPHAPHEDKDEKK